jgi:hypothetical protein
MVVLLEVSPISKEELELRQRDHRVVGHLPDQGPSPPIAQFGWAASSKKSLGGSKLLPFRNDGGRCVLWDLKCCRHLLVPFPRSVPRHNPVSELYGQFFRPHRLAWSAVGPYIDRCVPFQIMSNQFHLAQVDSNQAGETSQG